MAHNPVNHPAQPIFRVVGGLVGLYLAIFGILGVIATSGAEFLAQDDTRVLGQGANLGYSLVAGLLGVLILLGTGVGRNIDVRVNKWLGVLLMVIGVASVGLLRTDANFLNFTMTTCIVTMSLGLVLLTAAMYGKVGSEEEQQAWQEARLLL